MGNDHNRSVCYSAEKSIVTAFRGKIWRRFLAAVQNYELIREGDVIAVCISGGKDSILLAKCMQLLHRNTIIPFNLKFIAMDPGYGAGDRQQLIDTTAALEIPLEIFDTDIFTAVDKAMNSPCHVCACMRRGYLYKEAQLRGCNKIALGHHMDDVVETLLLGMIYCGEYKTMLPKLHSRNYKGMELIRPLYRIRESDITAWRDNADISCLNCACRVMRQETGGKRLAIKKLLYELEKENSNVVSNIFSSIQSISLDSLLEYQSGIGTDKVRFTDKYRNIATGIED